MQEAEFDQGQQQQCADFLDRACSWPVSGDGVGVEQVLEGRNCASLLLSPASPDIPCSHFSQPLARVGQKCLYSILARLPCQQGTRAVVSLGACIPPTLSCTCSLSGFPANLGDPATPHLPSPLYLRGSTLHPALPNPGSTHGPAQACRNMGSKDCARDRVLKSPSTISCSVNSP